ncbi:MAG: signal recognition particle subunit SRP19/SEC65 family protein, partial [Candidatus Bathyarchaeia archaeon]
MRKTDEVVLWPVYFDSTKTKSEGRKVPKRLGCPSPTLDMIERALQNLHLSYKLVPEASYPSFPWKRTGLVQVKKKKPKSQ